jgi:hypothetical protein
MGCSPHPKALHPGVFNDPLPEPLNALRRHAPGIDCHLASSDPNALHPNAGGVAAISRWRRSERPHRWGTQKRIHIPEGCQQRGLSPPAGFPPGRGITGDHRPVVALVPRAPPANCFHASGVGLPARFGQPPLRVLCVLRVSHFGEKQVQGNEVRSIRLISEPTEPSRNPASRCALWPSSRTAGCPASVATLIPSANWIDLTPLPPLLRLGGHRYPSP